MKSYKWEELLNNDEFQTGDILLIQHKKQYSNLFELFISFFDMLITTFSKSEYTHAAIIVKDPDFVDPPLKGLYILESGFETFPDAENNTYKVGAELEDFTKVMNSLKGSNVYYRKLVCERDETFYNNLKKAHTELHNKPYDILPTDWLKSAVHLNIGDTQSKNRFWCSALVAYVFVCFGFLPKDTPWTIVSPKMLGTEHPDKFDLKFEKCSLEKEIKIL